jgi:L-methionine (R)-S-oxide reductase
MAAQGERTVRFAAALERIALECRRDEADAQQAVDTLSELFDEYSWIGIYVVEGDDLVLGPWRGPEATEHVRIPIGQGICGAAASSGTTEIVDDVNADQRYLACFASTRSEIVVPIHLDGAVIGEIDIDSDSPRAFTRDDQAFLEAVAELIAPAVGAQEPEAVPPPGSRR